MTALQPMPLRRKLSFETRIHSILAIAPNSTAMNWTSRSRTASSAQYPAVRVRKLRGKFDRRDRGARLVRVSLHDLPSGLATPGAISPDTRQYARQGSTLSRVATRGKRVVAAVFYNLVGNSRPWRDWRKRGDQRGDFLGRARNTYNETTT
jgi:hypothetical protein